MHRPKCKALLSEKKRKIAYPATAHAIDLFCLTGRTQFCDFVLSVPPARTRAEIVRSRERGDGGGVCVRERERERERERKRRPE